MARYGAKPNSTDHGHLETNSLHQFNSDPSSQKRLLMDATSSRPDTYANPSSGHNSEKIPEFVSEHFFTSSHGLSQSHSEYSPYSLRLSQLSIPYQYDVLLLYDPEDDVCYLDKLMEYLEPQDLKIFDFNRDAPPGLPPQKVLQTSLRLCRYTCIVITQKFISNFWLQFRTDMSIQDMLDNQEKLYSVIVVVMDRSIKRTDLPLDLITLSPLFITDRFFNDRIKRAFSKTMPFPPSIPASSNFSKQEHTSGDQLPKYSDLSKGFHRSSNGGDSNPKDKSFQKSSAGINVHPHLDSEYLAPVFQASRTQNVIHTSSAKEPAFQSCGPVSRLPTEHSDSTYLLPPSFFPSASLVVSDQPAVERNVLRASSVTLSSTGSREPQEGTECGSVKSQADSIQQLGSLPGSKFSSGFDSSSTGISSVNNESSKNMESSMSSTCLEEDFSFLNLSNSSNSDSLSENHSGERGFESPGFFSIQSTIAAQSNFSQYSELEISKCSIPYPFNASLDRYDSSQKTDKSEKDVEASGASCATLCPGDDISLQSLPNLKPTFPIDVIEDSIPRCNSLGQEENFDPGKRLSRTYKDVSCSSLPEEANHACSDRSTTKRSRSLRSLVSMRLSRMSKTFRGKKNF